MARPRTSIPAAYIRTWARLVACAADRELRRAVTRDASRRRAAEGTVVQGHAQQPDQGLYDARRRSGGREDRGRVRAVLQSPVANRFLANPQGRLPVGLLTPAVQRWLGADANLVYLRARDARKLVRKHRLDKRDLLLVMTVLAEPHEAMRRMPARPLSAAELARRISLVREVDGALYHAVVQRSPDGKRVTLKTFYAVSRQYVEKLRTEAVTVFRYPE